MEKCMYGLLSDFVMRKVDNIYNVSASRNLQLYLSGKTIKMRGQKWVYLSHVISKYSKMASCYDKEQEINVSRVAVWNCKNLPILI